MKKSEFQSQPTFFSTTTPWENDLIYTENVAARKAVRAPGDREITDVQTLAVGGVLE
jgi:hypothetical protein